jgi:hypothetical protein
MLLSQPPVHPPSHEVLPRIRSSRPAADIQGFFKLVEEAFNQYCQNVQDIPEGAEPIFVHSFPEQRLTARTDKGADQSFDVITHHVGDAEMAATSNDGSRVPFAPATIETRPHPQKAGYNLITYGWWEKTVVVFTIWSKSNETADALAVWFHKFLMKYAFAFKYFLTRGVEHFKFEKRLEDDTETRQGQELYRRRLAYSFRLQYLDSYEAPQIRDVQVHTHAHPPAPTPVA